MRDDVIGLDHACRVLLVPRRDLRREALTILGVRVLEVGGPLTLLARTKRLAKQIDLYRIHIISGSQAPDDWTPQALQSFSYWLRRVEAQNFPYIQPQKIKNGSAPMLQFSRVAALQP